MGFFGLWRRKHSSNSLGYVTESKASDAESICTPHVENHQHVFGQLGRSLLIKSFRELIHQHHDDTRSIHSSRSDKLVGFNEKVRVLLKRLNHQRRERPKKSILKNSNRNIDEEIVNLKKYMELRDHYFDQVLVKSSYYGETNGYQHGGNEAEVLRMKQLISQGNATSKEGFAATILQVDMKV